MGVRLGGPIVRVLGRSLLTRWTGRGGGCGGRGPALLPRAVLTRPPGVAHAGVDIGTLAVTAALNLSAAVGRAVLPALGVGQDARDVLACLV